MRPNRCHNSRAACADLLRRENGSTVVVVMMFIFVFVLTAVALYWLITGQSRATVTERKDVRAFNVAEAGIDAGMLSLKLHWPKAEGDSASPTEEELSALKTTLQTANPGLSDPTRSSASEFLQVAVYDNVDTSTAEPYQTTTVADPNAPTWDYNKDGRMFVDAWSNVDDARRRIIVLAEKEVWPINLPGYACLSNIISSNGQELEVNIEDGTSALVGTTVNPQGKGITTGEGVDLLVGPTYSFDSVITPKLVAALKDTAQSQGTYFDQSNSPGGDPAEAAETLMANGGANGKVVYVKSTTGAVKRTANDVGTVAEPVVVLIDTPDGSENGFDIRGNSGFTGVVIVIGNSTLRGTSSIHGAIYCGGTLLNKGNGQCGEIYYNETVIFNINNMSTISVSIVPNTWEEYTLPDMGPTGN